MAMFEKKLDKNKVEEAKVEVPSAPEKAAPPVQPVKASGSAAVVGATIRVKGDITGDEDLMVEGSIEGTVRLDKHDLTIGETAKVHANVTAKVVRVDGEVIGDVRGIERVIIAKAGRVQGNISAPRVMVEDGAKFRGSVEMDGFEGKAPSAS